MIFKNNLRLYSQLQLNYGIGKNQVKVICQVLGLSSGIKNKDLTKFEKTRIIEYIKQRIRVLDIPFSTQNIHLIPICDSLKYCEQRNITNLIKKNSYRGFRHKKRLPVRGQRTHTNAQTFKKLAITFLKSKKSKSKSKSKFKSKSKLKK